MPAPNIVTATTITGQTGVLAVTTIPSAIVTCAASHVCKVNGLMVSNIGSGTTADVTVDIYRSTVATRIVYLVTIPPKTSLPVLGKDVLPLYLEEGDVLRLTASADLMLEAAATYENIS